MYARDIQEERKNPPGIPKAYREVNLLSANDVKYYASLKQKKYRKEHKQFLIEGFHLIEECLNSPYELEYIILRNDVDLSGHPGILSKISKNKTKVDALHENAFNKLVETESSQGVIGVVNQPANTETEEGDIILALDTINDPGNLGTIIRTAYWFNIKSILLSENSADVFNSKVIRSSQGGVFHVNILEDCDLQSQLQQYKNKNAGIYLFTLDGETKLREITKSTEKKVLVFGNESRGISDELIEQEYNKIRIEGYSGCESLNVAISCGIVLYELTRQA